MTVFGWTRPRAVTTAINDRTGSASSLGLRACAEPLSCSTQGQGLDSDLPLH